MKILVAVFVSLTALSSCLAITQSDADIAKALVGTWIDSPSDQAPMHGRVTYFADGHGVELVWPAGQLESTAVRVETRWSVTNGVLVISSVSSSDPQKIPAGIELRDRVLSVSSERFVFEPESYGTTEKKKQTRIRVKEGSNHALHRTAAPRFSFDAPDFSAGGFSASPVSSGSQ